MREEGPAKVLRTLNATMKIWLPCLAMLLLGPVREAFAAPPSPSEAVRPLAELAAPGAWQLREGDTGLDIAEVDHRLAIAVTLAKTKEARLLLRRPLEIPVGYELSFVMAAKEFGRPLWIFPLVRDSTGREYLFHSASNASLSPNSNDKGLFLGGRFRHGLEGVCESRFSVPGLRHLDAPSPNFEPVKAGDPRPVAPLTLLGLRIKRNNEGPDIDDDVLYLRQFAWNSLNSQNTQLHYQFDDQECFGELDGLPQLTIGDLGKRYGQSFDISWDIRDGYAGQPFLAGHRQVQLDPESKALPYALQRSQRVEFPVRQQGTYWVRVKLRWANQGTAPEETIERDYRLFVIKGEAPVERSGIAATEQIGGSLIRIAPERKSLVWSADEPLIVPMTFFAPSEGSEPAAYRLRALSTRGEVLADVTGDVVASAGKPLMVNFDLAKLPPGPYDIDATVTAAGHTIDQTRRLIGKRPSEPPAADLAKIPDGVPSYQQILTGDKSLFHLDPMIGDSLVNDQTSRADVGRKFMDMAKGVSHDLEWQVLWRDVEPLPGVYDFSTVDRVLADAQQRGFSVLLWAALQDYPEWLPSLYTQNDQGEIFGQSFYLFHGARLNLVQAAPLRDAAQRFLRNLVIHSRSHPAVQGYFYLLEHPGDAPYSGWYEGFDPQTLANFRAYCRTHYASIDLVNRAWRTEFASFDVIDGPRRAKAVTDQYWLDWMRFRSGAIHEFLLDCAKTIRKEDPKRLIMVYADGLEPDRLGEFRELGCMTANGGCADPERGAPDYIQAAAEGVPQRAEEVTVGQWSAKSPTQLDASLFAMLLGGGGNANCKTYVDVQTCLQAAMPSLDVLRKPPYSLDRYERFMPIWNELRPTEVPPAEVRYFSDYDSYLVQTKTTYQGWNADPWATMNLLDSHLLFGPAPGRGWKTAKLLVLIRGNIDVMRRQTIEELAKYVERGGTLLMRADAGRRCVEEPDADWTLLRRFGFTPPVGPRVDNQYVRAVPAPGGVLPADERALVLRDTWNAASAQPGQAVALFEGDPKRPAVSEVKLGRGRVYVVWATTLVPPSQQGGYPLLRQVAARAGVTLPVDADSPHLWLNMLTNRSGTTHYGLVYCTRTADEQAERGKVRFTIPEGTYQVRELISGANLGRMTAATIREQGLEPKLARDAVAIYRFESTSH